jgi:PAS domain S-box-containing protein
MKFASKITLSAAMVSLVALPLLVFSVFYLARDVLQKSIAKDYLEIAQQQMNNIDHNLYTAFRDIQMIAASEFFEKFVASDSKADQAFPAMLSNELQDLAMYTGPWDLLTVVDKEGVILISTDKTSVGRVISEYPTCESAYRNALAGNPYYSDLVLSCTSSRPTIMFAAPIRNVQGENSVAGVVLGHFAWPMVIQALDEIAPPATAHLNNSKGKTIADSTLHTNALIDHKHDGNELTIKLLADTPWGSAIIEEGFHGESGTVLAVYASQNGLFSYEGSGWQLFLEVPLAKALAPVSLLAKKITALVAAVVIFMMAVLYYVGKVLARPVEELTETVEQVSHENLTVKAKVNTKDEVGELARSFNKMTETLQKTTVSRNYVDNILKTMRSTLIVINPSATIVAVNQATLQLLGYQEEELLGQPIDLIINDPAILRGELSTGQRAIVDAEIAYLSKDGCLMPMLFSSSAIYDELGNVQDIVCAATDISERKKQEEKLRRSSRALSATHASSMLLARADNEQQLFKSVCHNIVEQTGHQFACICLQEKDTAGIINPVAWAGEESGYLASLQRRKQSAEQQYTPEATALESKIPYIEMNLKNAPQHLHWRKEACKYGFASVIAFPLLREAPPFAVLAIYSAQANAFETNEIRLLSKLADDLAYGTTAIRIKQNNKQAEKKSLIWHFMIL